MNQVEDHRINKYLLSKKKKKKDRKKKKKNQLLEAITLVKLKPC